MAQHQVKIPTLLPDKENHLDFKAFELNPRIVARDQAQEVRLWFAPEDVVVLVA
jgi:hypothetical protein